MSRCGVVGLIAIVVAAAVPLVAGQHVLTALIVALHASYIALAWNVAAGYAGQFSLGHSLFYGIGAYASTMLYLTLGLTPWAGMFAGAAIAGVVGVLLALGVYRYNVRGIFFALVTLGAAEVAKGLADNWDWIKGPVGILLTMKAAPGEFFFLRREPYYYVALAMVVVMIAISLVLERSRLGQHFLAVREDEAAAEASGVDTYRAKTVAIGLSAALTAVRRLVLRAVLSLRLTRDRADVRAAADDDAGHDGRRRRHRDRPRAGLGALQRARRGAAELAAREHAPGGHRLSVHGVSKRFGGLQALSQVTFGVGHREIVGIIGPNGAGKTTLFNIITGVYTPEEGRVELRGMDVTGWAPHRICQLGAARTFQIGKPFAALSVLQTVRIGALNRMQRMADATAHALKVLELVGLADKREHLGKNLTVIERKRLELARALATGPALLLLDEVAAGLRPNEIQEMIALVRRIAAGGVSVLIIEHVLEAVMRLSARIVVLNYGEVIAEGTPQSLVNDPRVIEAYLGEAYTLA